MAMAMAVLWPWPWLSHVPSPHPSCWVPISSPCWGLMMARDPLIPLPADLGSSSPSLEFWPQKAHIRPQTAWTGKGTQPFHHLRQDATHRRKVILESLAIQATV